MIPRLSRPSRGDFEQILGPGWERLLEPPRAAETAREEETAIDTEFESRNNKTLKCFLRSSASISSGRAGSA
jgi:hypothetical protein